MEKQTVIYSDETQTSYGSVSGYGYGYGDGSGDGSGSGYGYGDGSGMDKHSVEVFSAEAAMDRLIADL